MISMSKRGLVFFIFGILVISLASFAAAQEGIGEGGAFKDIIKPKSEAECGVIPDILCCKEYNNAPSTLCACIVSGKDPARCAYCENNLASKATCAIEDTFDNSLNGLRNSWETLKKLVTGVQTGGEASGRLEEWAKGVSKEEADAIINTRSCNEGEDKEFFDNVFDKGTDPREAKCVPEEVKNALQRSFEAPEAGIATEAQKEAAKKQASVSGTATLTLSSSGGDTKVPLVEISSTEDVKNYQGKAYEGVSGPGCSAYLSFILVANKKTKTAALNCAIQNDGPEGATGRVSVCGGYSKNCDGTVTARLSSSGTASGTVSIKTIIPSGLKEGGVFEQTASGKWTLTSESSGGGGGDEGQLGVGISEEKDAEEGFKPIESLVGAAGSLWNGAKEAVQNVIGGGGQQQVTTDNTPQPSDETGECKASFSCTEWQPSDNECRGGLQRRSCSCSCANGKCSGNRESAKFCRNSASGYPISGQYGVQYSLDVQEGRLALLGAEEGVSQGGVGMREGESTTISISAIGDGVYEITLSEFPRGITATSTPNEDKTDIKITVPEGTPIGDYQGALKIMQDGKELKELPFIIGVESSEEELLKEAAKKFSLLRLLLLVGILILLIYFFFILVKRFRDKDEDKKKTRKASRK